MATVFVKLMGQKNITGYAVSRDRKFNSPPSEQSAEPVQIQEESQIRLDKDLQELVKKFVSSMYVYLDFVPMIMHMVPAMSYQAVLASMRTYLESNSLTTHDDDDAKIYELDTSKYRDFSRIADHLDPSVDVQDTLSANALMGLVAVLDVLLADLTRLVITRHPGALENSPEQFSIRDVLSFQDYAEFKSALITAEVEKLGHKGLDERVSWFETKMKIDPIDKGFEGWADLNEVIQRRNLIAHTRGIVSRYYMENSKKYKYDTQGISIGDKLEINFDYYRSAVERVFEFGVMLAHIVRKKMGARENPSADSYLNELGFHLLVRGDYNLACRINEFAFNARGVKERTQKMAAVNYANSLKFLDRGAETERVLSKIDWSASSSDFSVCVAAVKGDIDGVVFWMKKIGNNGTVSEAGYREWPAFFHVRKLPQFSETYEAVFGVPYRPGPVKRDALSEIAASLREKTSTEYEQRGSNSSREPT